MSRPERAYRASVRLLSAVFVLIGVAILAMTLARGGGPLSVGVLLGVAFIAIGALRFWTGAAFGTGGGDEGGGNRG